MSDKNSPLILGTEPIGKLLTQYAIPAIIAMTASSLYNMADSIFIGHGVGAMGIAGLALTFPLMNLAAAFGSLVGVGASTLVSVKLGQKDYEGANNVLGNVFMLNLIMGVAFSVVFLLFLDPVLYFFGASEQTISYARDYMRIILYGNVITHMYLGLNSVLRSSGYPKMAMFATLLSVVVNCLLNPLFIFVLDWGIKGAAWATVFSQLISLVGQLIHFSRPTQLLHFHKGIYKLHKELVDAIISIGMSPFLMNLCSCLIVLLINWGLKEHGGDMAIGAYGIVNRVLMLFVMIVNGLNQGMQPIVGYNYGARQFDRVIRTLKLNIVCAVCVTTFGFILGHFFPHLVAGMFTDDPTLLSVAEMGLKISLLAFPIAGFQIVSSGFFQYIGKPQKAILLSLTRQLLFLVPLLAVLPDLYGTMGVWASMPIADCLAAFLAGVLLFFQIRKMRRHPDEIKVI